MSEKENGEINAYLELDEDSTKYKRLFMDDDIESFLNFFDKYFTKRKLISIDEIENKLREIYGDFERFNESRKSCLIDDIIHTSGNIQYNDSNIVCYECGCKYVAKLTGGYLRKRKHGEDNGKNELRRHAYGCIITGEEKCYECLGCGKKW